MRGLFHCVTPIFLPTALPGSWHSPVIDLPCSTHNLIFFSLSPSYSICAIFEILRERLSRKASNCPTCETRSQTLNRLFKASPAAAKRPCRSIPASSIIIRDKEATGLLNIPNNPNKDILLSNLNTARELCDQVLHLLCTYVPKSPQGYGYGAPSPQPPQNYGYGSPPPQPNYSGYQNVSEKL